MTKLRKPHKKAKESLTKQLIKAKSFLSPEKTNTEERLQATKAEFSSWQAFTSKLLNQMFTSEDPSNEFLDFGIALYNSGESLKEKQQGFATDVDGYSRRLNSIIEQLELYDLIEEEPVSQPAVGEAQNDDHAQRTDLIGYLFWIKKYWHKHPIVAAILILLILIPVVGVISAIMQKDNGVDTVAEQTVAPDDTSDETSETNATELTSTTGKGSGTPTSDAASLPVAKVPVTTGKGNDKPTTKVPASTSKGKGTPISEPKPPPKIATVPSPKLPKPAPPKKKQYTISTKQLYIIEQQDGTGRDDWYCHISVDGIHVKETSKRSCRTKSILGFEYTYTFTQSVTFQFYEYDIIDPDDNCGSVTITPANINDLSKEFSGSTAKAKLSWRVGK